MDMPTVLKILYGVSPKRAQAAAYRPTHGVATCTMLCLQMVVLAREAGLELEMGGYKIETVIIVFITLYSSSSGI